MGRTRGYKNFEKKAISSFGKAFVGFLGGCVRIFARVVGFLDQKLTIMIVPHSQQRVINFQTHVFAVILGMVLIGGICASFLYFNKKSLTSAVTISRLEKQNRETLASLDEMRDENVLLLQAAKQFETALTTTLARLGIGGNKGQTTAGSGDLSALFNAGDHASGAARETAEIRELTGFLENSVQPIEQIGKMLEAHGTLLSDIPSIWPVSNPAITHLSMKFGQNIHPITGQLYLHKGLDFSTYRYNDPVIATANGQVVTVAWDDGFGLYVIVKHKHGIYTRYAHLNTFRVQRGQFVSQGDVIGLVGNTGVSTGPHLHYEVHIGSEVVDPEKYINIKAQ